MGTDPVLVRCLQNLPEEVVSESEVEGEDRLRVAIIIRTTSSRSLDPVAATLTGSLSAVATATMSLNTVD